MKNYAQTIGETGVTYTIAGGLKLPTLSDFISTPKSDLGGYRPESTISLRQKDGESLRNSQNATRKEKPGKNQSVPSKELSSKKPKNKAGVIHDKTEQTEENLLDNSETVNQPDETDLTEQDEVKEGSKADTIPLLNPNLTSTPKIAVEPESNPNDTHPDMQLSSPDKEQVVTKDTETLDDGSPQSGTSKGDEQNTTEGEINKKSLENGSQPVDNADESNKPPKNYTFITDKEFESIYKGNSNLILLLDLD